MKRLIVYITILSIWGCSFEKPAVFSAEALNETLIGLDGKETDLRSVLDGQSGKLVMLDLWASWCRDCLVSVPDLKSLKEDHPEVQFVFLSYDRSEQAWRNSLEKYEFNGLHYFVPSGKRGPLGKFVGLSWIPRYMVISKDGKIKLFKATEAKDEKLKNALL